ncbi:MAG: DUF1499 domain-containing protein [Pirellulales bacterium]
MLLWLPAALVVGIILLFAAVLATTVEDWSRDLSQNRAETRADHADPRLQPFRSRESPAELADRVVAAAGELRGWQLVERQENGEAIELHLTRTTPLWRFVDDVRATIRRVEGETELSASSQSRVGKGDLGQNPRNLRELLDKVRAGRS